jgi:hypothetical protein
MLGAFGDGGVILRAAAPYSEFLAAYHSYARLSVYARVLSEAEIGRLRDEVARRAKEPNLEWSLVKMVESFRTEPDR